MTFGTLAFAHESATHPAKSFRNMLAAVYGLPMVTHANAVSPTTRGGGHGVVGGGDMFVTSTGGVGYSIAAGLAVVSGTSALGQGVYGVYNDAAVAGSMTRDATNPRINLVAVRVRDTDVDGSGGEDAAAVLIEGTPAGTPTVPTLTAGLGSLLILSEVLVPSTANGGALAYTDRRPFAAALGGTVRCKSTSRPSNPWQGMEIHETDTFRKMYWNFVAWEILSEPRQAWSVSTVTQSGSVAVTTTAGWYQRSRGVFHGHLKLAVTGTGTSGFLIAVTLPVTLAAVNDVGGSAYIEDTGTDSYFAAVRTTGGTTQVTFLNNLGYVGTAFALASGDIIELTVSGSYV